MSKNTQPLPLCVDTDEFDVNERKPSFWGCFKRCHGWKALLAVVALLVPAAGFTVWLEIAKFLTASQCYAVGITLFGLMVRPLADFRQRQVDSRQVAASTDEEVCGSTTLRY